MFFLLDLDLFMTLAKNVTQACNKLPSATFYIPECRLLLGNGVIYDEKKTCRELLEDIVDNDKGFSQGKLNTNQRSMAAIKKVYCEYPETCVVCSCFKLAFKVHRPDSHKLNPLIPGEIIALVHFVSKDI